MKKTIVYGIAAAVLSAAAASAEEAAPANNDDILKRLEALEAKSASSSWTDHIKLKGDVRARFEHVDVDNSTSKSRLRGRARLGAYADVNDRVYAGIRIATGSDDSPTSTNQSLEDFANKRSIWLDLMYMGYKFERIDGLYTELGKVKQPWLQVSDLMYDGDVNPEGLNFGYEKEWDMFSLTANAGYFTWQDKVSDNPVTDATMGAGQLAGAAQFTDNIKLTAGINAFIYNNVKGSEIPVSESDNGTTTVTNSAGEATTVQVVKTKTLNKGNTTDGDGNWLYGYELIEYFTQIDVKNKIIPFKLYADYIMNAASDVEADTAWLVGAGLKYKKFGFDYNYRDLEADAVLGILADSDFAGGGTGGKGHKFKLKYSLLKNWSAGLTYFIAENSSGQDVNTLQADLAVKF